MLKIFATWREWKQWSRPRRQSTLSLVFGVISIILSAISLIPIYFFFFKDNDTNNLSKELEKIIEFRVKKTTIRLSDEVKVKDEKIAKLESQLLRRLRKARSDSTLTVEELRLEIDHCNLLRLAEKVILTDLIRTSPRFSKHLKMVWGLYKKWIEITKASRIETTAGSMVPLFPKDLWIGILQVIIANFDRELSRIIDELPIKSDRLQHIIATLVVCK